MLCHFYGERTITVVRLSVMHGSPSDSATAGAAVVGAAVVGMVGAAVVGAAVVGATVIGRGLGPAGGEDVGDDVSSGGERSGCCWRFCNSEKKGLLPVRVDDQRIFIFIGYSILSHRPKWQGRSAHCETLAVALWL